MLSTEMQRQGVLTKASSSELPAAARQRKEFWGPSTARPSVNEHEAVFLRSARDDSLKTVRHNAGGLPRSFNFSSAPLAATPKGRRGALHQVQNDIHQESRTLRCGAKRHFSPAAFAARPEGAPSRVHQAQKGLTRKNAL